MASEKAIALFGAYQLHHPFKVGMKITKMPMDAVGKQRIRHICLEGRGLSYLYPKTTTLRDKTTFHQVTIWGCPYCGRFYYHTERVGELYGEPLLQWKQQAKVLTMQGRPTDTIPNESFYAQYMVDQSDDWETQENTLANRPSNTQPPLQAQFGQTPTNINQWFTQENNPQDDITDDFDQQFDQLNW